MSNPKKPSQKAVLELLTEWETLSRQKATLLAKEEKALAPFRAQFEAACKPTIEATAAKVKPIQTRLAEVEKEITRLMESGIGPDGQVALPFVKTEAAEAVVKTSSKRAIDAKEFFDFYPGSKRTADFWNCLSVGIAKAEKFMGADIDKLAGPTFSHQIIVKFLNGGK